MTFTNWLRLDCVFHIFCSSSVPQPQTLLLTPENELKTLEEVEEIEATLIEDYNLDPTRVGILTPERKQTSSSEGRNKNNNSSSTPRKLIMTPEENGTLHRNSDWKILAATDMAGQQPFQNGLKRDGKVLCFQT